MNLLLNSISQLLSNVGIGASTYCSIIFFEPEVPESLREEE